MSSVQLLEPIFDGGLRSVNFFNGRQLSGEDLTQEQKANREASHRFGHALGDGIAYGLEVSENLDVSTAQIPVVTVQPGLAINRKGQTLVLKSATDVSLIKPADTASLTSTSAFGPCQPPQTTVYLDGVGVYLLTMEPAPGTQGRAPVSGLGNVLASCNTNYLLQGVKFRLTQLNLAATVLADTNHLRNRVAHLCFGTTDPRKTAFLADPLATPSAQYGLLDDMRPNLLTDCEVPLALIYWTEAGIQFIDLWSVRRRITKPACTVEWTVLIADRIQSEAEAMFLEFQAHIEDIVVNEENLSTIKATDRFNFLPPVGIIPLGSMGSVQGFDLLGFFGGLKCREKPAFIEGAKLRSLVHDARSFPPIDVSSKELIWQYLVRENFQAIDNAKGNPPQPSLILANGQIPFRGQARYNLSRWNYSNYS